MPIDYSKFDGIGDDEEEDEPRAGRGPGDGNLAQLLQCLQQLGEEPGKGAPAVPGMEMMQPPSPAADMLDYESVGSPRPLDLAGLRAEAWQLLVDRLVVRPGAANVQRRLLLEAELQLQASNYRPALLAALALQMAGDAGLAGGIQGLPGGDWAASAAVVEMVAAYQLGDREHAIMLRDSLQRADCSVLSQYLKKRYEGTSEVLELVPEFLHLLKAAEQDERARRPVGAY